MIPVARPKLPAAERLVPYLREIDTSRYYSNFGPLTSRLEDRLAAHFGLPDGAVTTVANATQGLTLTLLAQGARPGMLCAMPAWTFVASPHAAVNAGLIPYFIDVDPDTWALDVETVVEEIGRAPAPVGAVMPVAPFGQPLPVAAWDEFRAKTGLPVVIDAAAGFDSLVPGATPTVVSLHATKILATGEGGIVVSRDMAVIRDIRARSNFGFVSSRQAERVAVNAKMSEYHAAVGHAGLDQWREVRGEWMRAAADYRQALGRSNKVRLQDGFGESWVASTCVVQVANGGASKIEAALAAAGVETRRWWCAGAQAHPATECFPRAALAATNALAASTLGLPLYRDLTSADIEKISEIVISPT